VAGPTQTEIVRKLGESVSTLFALAEHLKEDLSRVEGAVEKMTETVQEMTTKFAVIEERLNELKRVSEESSRRKFSVWQGILCAVLGAALALAGQVGLVYLKAYLG
jgi:predicted nucleic acid-binding protein